MTQRSCGRKVTYQLRPYQQDGVSKALWYIQNYNNPFIVVMATGAGKSLVIADICHKLDEPVLILQPSKEILEQNYAKLVSYDPLIDAGIFSASKNRKEIRKFTYATIGSIYKKPEMFQHFKYVIIDECHLVNPKNLGGMYSKFLTAIGCKNVCGLTATPYRMVSKYFVEDGQMFYTGTLKMVNRIHPFFFKKIAYKIETQDLIDQGFLSPIEYHEGGLDYEALQTNKGGTEFDSDSVEEFWTGRGGHRLKMLAEAVQHMDKNHKGNLIFCSSIKQATTAVDMLEVMGITCEMVTGDTPTKEREAIIKRFKSGETKHLANVGVFTTGFDVPSLDCITLARPTMSLALYYQMIGRGVRIDPENPNKVLHVYDFSGAVQQHGRVESIRITKEPDGFRDRVESEWGIMTDEPLFTYLIKDMTKKHRFSKGAKNSAQTDIFADASHPG